MGADRYDVFLSYSHADAALAERISRRIRNYRPPRAAGLPRRKLEVFRDRERLTANPDLAQLLADTVGVSTHLVLLASPSAAQSEYVDKEVATFLERKSLAGISVVACRGELPENLPPALRARVGEPLYIDLREAGRRTFRLETLRLIAALHGVDYSELRREDDLRRLRNRGLAVAATVMLAISLASAYLVNTTAAEAWEQVRQPATSAGPDPLMPIERVAVSTSDPSAVVWLGDNARFKRDLANVRETWMPPADGVDGFDQRVKARLSASAPDSASQPAATVSLEASRGRDLIGSGELRIYGALEKGVLRYGRTFRFTPVDSSRRSLAMPLTLLDVGRSPFDLEPSPAEDLRRVGYDTSTMNVTGALTDHTTGERSSRFEFAVSDNRADMREVLDAIAGPEHVVLSTSETHASQLREQLENSGAEELWTTLAADPSWSVYRPPERSKPLTFARESRDVREDARAAHLDAALADTLDSSLLRGDIVEFQEVSRQVGDKKVAVATLQGIIDSHEAVAAPPLRHYFHAGGSGRWLLLKLPVDTTSAHIVDVIPLDASLRTVMVVTDREGLYRSTDDGESWQSADFAEPRLRNGERVRVLVAASSVFVLAALHREPGDESNPLFRLTHRDWIRRWRLGLARVLTGPAQ
jgi:TIR domain